MHIFAKQSSLNPCAPIGGEVMYQVVIEIKSFDKRIHFGGDTCKT